MVISEPIKLMTYTQSVDDICSIRSLVMFFTGVVDQSLRRRCWVWERVRRKIYVLAADAIAAGKLLEIRSA